jgi:hypothetical protein
MHFKPRGGLNDVAHPVQIAHARQLHQNLVVAQAVRRNHRLADAQLSTRSRMVSIAWSTVLCLQRRQLRRLHGQRDGVVRAAAVMSYSVP